MIPKNKIIDDYEIKLPNKIRDDSLIKFCEENNCDDLIDTIHTDEEGKQTPTKHCIDHLQVKRSYKGELQCWEIHYKKV
tara:strand:+ start:549 stop:785 length:237 start_codon:yes stop_codon:yes gene_type:complete